MFVNSIFNDEFILDIRYARLIFIFFQETSSIKLSEKKSLASIITKQTIKLSRIFYCENIDLRNFAIDIENEERERMTNFFR